MAEHYNPIKYISNGSDTYEIESVGVRIDDDNTTGDRAGSTVLVSDTKNVNLEAGKNILFKTKKGKVVFDTTMAINAGNGNETQVISKVKENITTGNNGQYRTESTAGYCGDHGDILVEARRVRIKPFNNPKWAAGDPESPSPTTAHGKDKYEGYIYLDTAGYEATDAGGDAADSASSEASFEIRVGNNGTSNSGLTTAEYRPLTVKTRGIDLRCMTHGGIAVQPCGYDQPAQTTHHENKIKFESSRIQDIYASDIKEDENGNLYIDNSKSGYIYNTGSGDKWVKGGDGLEFGTFNNLHTSIYTRDYRFNKDGIVYAADRELYYEDANKNQYELQADGYHKITSGVAAAVATTPTPVIVKADYKTQTDDFKDKIGEDTEKASWKAIVKTASAFNSDKARHAKVTGAGNTEIETKVTYHWVEQTGVTPGEEDAVVPTYCSDMSIVYNEGDFDDTNTMPSTSSSYKTGGKSYKFVAIESPKLNLKSGATIGVTAQGDVDIESKNDDVKLKANDAVKLEAPELRFTGTTMVSFSTTPKVTFLSQKFKASGKFEAVNTLFTTGVLNNTAVTTYYNASTGVMKVPVENIYTNAECTTLVTTTTPSGTAIYHKVNNVGVQCEKDTKYFTLIDSVAYVIETKGSVGQIKNNGITQCTDTDYPNVTFVSADYTVTSGEVAILPGEITPGAASCSAADMITLVSWMKANNQGPWAS